MAPRLVSISEAAKLLAAAGDQVERSALSRYVANNAAALRPRKAGKSVVVDFDALAALRRRHLGKQHHRDHSTDQQPVPEPEGRRSERRAPDASGLSLSDERIGKFQAETTLRLMALRERLSGLMRRDVALYSFACIVPRFRHAIAFASVEMAAELASRFGGDPDAITDVLYLTGRVAGDTFVTVLEKAGFYTGTVEPCLSHNLLEEWMPAQVDAEIMDEARAAKAQVDRLHKELTLAERTGSVVSLRDLEFNGLDAFERAKIELSMTCRDQAVPALTHLLAIEDSQLRSLPRTFERAVLKRFAAVLH